MFMLAIFIVLIASTFHNQTIAQVTDDESCETLQSEVHITKGMTFYYSSAAFTHDKIDQE